VDLASRLTAVPTIDPARPAWQFQGRWRPWAYLSAASAVLDEHLERLGQGPGARVGVLMRNRPEIAASAIVLLATRRCLVTLSSAVPAAVLAEELREMRLPVVVVSEIDADHAQLVEACQAAGSALLVIADRAETAEVSVTERVAIDPAADHATPAADVAVRMLTSGTTGRPKRVDLLYRSLEREAESTRRYSRAGRNGSELRLSGAVDIQWIPLLHVGGVRALIAAVLDGRMISLMERFDVDEWVSLVREHRPRTALLVPSTLRMLCDADLSPEDFAGISAVFCGTAPLDPSMRAEFTTKYGVPVLEVYGATEYAGGVAGWTLRDWERHGAEKSGSVGRANSGVELRVVDPATGEALEPDEPGILQVKAPQLETDGWLHTTDRARIDADGFLYVLGRVDDVIIRGGLKVHAEDVIAALRCHPAVRDAAVVGVPDRRLGAVPMAAVELEDGLAVDGPGLVEHLRERLPAYQVPVRIEILDRLPRTPSMKVSRPDVLQALGVNHP
jgi:acyl-coenzyme A synthetase/AMP-(fatty) acid ligase